MVQAIHQQGLSQRQAAVEFCILEPSVISTWLHHYAQGGVSALQTKVRGRKPKLNKALKSNNKPDDQKNQQELLEELLYLRAELAYLKKLNALIQQEQIQDKKPESSQD